VTSPLTDDDPTVPFQRGDDSLIAKARDLGHTAISVTSVPGVKGMSSSTGSR
jgi:hypothetical protein